MDLSGSACIICFSSSQRKTNQTVNSAVSAPLRWANDYVPWVKELVGQNFKNVFKKMIVRKQKSGDRMQEIGVIGQNIESRSQKIENRKQKSGDRKQKSGNRNQKSEIRR